MAIDHLMGDDPGLEDPVMFAVGEGRADLRVLAVVPGTATLWLSLPFVPAGAGLALGLHARREAPSGPAIAAIVIATLVLVVGSCAYLVQLVNKLA